MDGEPDETLWLLDGVRERLDADTRIFVDALWRFDPARRSALAGSLMRAARAGLKRRSSRKMSRALRPGRQH